jgi:hypothetical protein
MTFGRIDVVVVVVGSVGGVTLPTHAQNGRTFAGPLLHSAAAGAWHVTLQVCAGLAWFVAEQDDDPMDTCAVADAGIRIATARSQKTRTPCLLTQNAERILARCDGN